MLYMVIEEFRNGDPVPDEPALLEEWMSPWRDLTDFEVIPVTSSAAAAARIAPQL